MLTDAELQGFAAQALNIAKHDIEQNGEFNFLLASYHESDTPPIHRMTSIETLIIGRLGKDWLNNGRKKDVGFYMLRMAVKMLPPDAVVFATAANKFKATAKLAALPMKQQLDMLDTNHDRHHQMVKEGLLELHDTLCVLVQTPTRVCQYAQEIHHGQFVGKPEMIFTAQAVFDGRLKMYT
jgi:hypothetical protein